MSKVSQETMMFQPVADNKNVAKTIREVTQALQEKGYNIARRTVAKYREQLNVPVARLRKEL